MLCFFVVSAVLDLNMCFVLTLCVYTTLFQTNVKMDAATWVKLVEQEKAFSYHFRLKQDWNGKSCGACQKNSEPSTFWIIKKQTKVKSFFFLSSNQICELQLRTEKKQDRLKIGFKIVFFFDQFGNPGVDPNKLSFFRFSKFRC